jgi:hypothetical protein
MKITTKTIIEEGQIVLVRIECDVCGHEMFLQESVLESIGDDLVCPKCSPEAFQKLGFQKL